MNPLTLKVMLIFHFDFMNIFSSFTLNNEIIRQHRNREEFCLS